MPNVVVFGESGGGKSSTINLLLGEKVAKESDSAIGCTFHFEKYEGPDYTFFDTVGLGEGSQGTAQQSAAVSQLIKLLKSLKDGVSLLIFVMEKGRIKKSLEENYNLFTNVICMGKVPVVLMITHCEMEEVSGTWWTENKTHFDKYFLKLSCPDVQCTTIQPHLCQIIAELNQKSKVQLKNEIAKHKLPEPWVVKGGWRNWFMNILSGIIAALRNAFPYLSWFFPDNIQDNSFEDRICRYFIEQGYSEKEASRMAEEIAISV